MRILKKRNGQSTSEFAVLVVVVIGALLVMQNYMKRGISGRWKEAVDNFGEQYDPTVMNTLIHYSLTSESNSVTKVEKDASGKGFWTNRYDTGTRTETRTGSSAIGGY